MAMLLSIITGGEKTLKGITAVLKQPMISTDSNKYFIGDGSTPGGTYLGAAKTVKDMARYEATVYDANCALIAQDSCIYIDGSKFADDTYLTINLKTSILGMFEPKLFVKNIVATLASGDSGQLTSDQLLGIFTDTVEDATDKADGWKVYGAGSGHITIQKDSGNNWFILEGAWVNQGSVGTQGNQGASGYSGIGTSGYSGYVGAQGATGAQGTSGYSGATGAQGTSGYSGTQGAQGAVGTSGYSGYSGPQGDAGASGYSGI
jgi:hypothetical protein